MESMEALQREFIYVWYYFELQLRQIFGYWVLGMAIGSAVSVFAKDGIHNLFRRMSGKGCGVLGIVPACLLGIVSPLCAQRRHHPGDHCRKPLAGQWAQDCFRKRQLFRRGSRQQDRH